MQFPIDLSEYKPLQFTLNENSLSPDALATLEKTLPLYVIALCSSQHWPM